MAAEKLQDMQNVVFTLPTGAGNSLKVAVTHGLKDRAGGHLVPTVITPEIISITGASLPKNVSVDLIERSSPEDGTVDVTASACSDNASGGNWVVTVRLTSLYMHSLAGADRTA